MASVVPRVQMISSALRALMNLAARARAASNAVRGAHAQLVDAAMDVGVVALVVIDQRLNHRARFLRRGGVVEIDQRLAVDFLVQDREVRAEFGPVGSWNLKKPR
jgi:hypothetical protein